MERHVSPKNLQQGFTFIRLPDTQDRMPTYTQIALEHVRSKFFQLVVRCTPSGAELLVKRWGHAVFVGQATLFI